MTSVNQYLSEKKWKLEALQMWDLFQGNGIEWYYIVLV